MREGWARGEGETPDPPKATKHPMEWTDQEDLIFQIGLVVDSLQLGFWNDALNQLKECVTELEQMILKDPLSKE